MRYLLDTCVLSETVRRRPERSVLEWLNAHDESALYLSVLTIGEIHKGIAKISDDERKLRLIRWVNESLGPRFGKRILPIDAAVADAWGEIAGNAERVGTPVPVIDGLLAATAKIYHLDVVTRNTDHFVRCGVRVTDPWVAT